MKGYMIMSSWPHLVAISVSKSPILKYNLIDASFVNSPMIFMMNLGVSKAYSEVFKPLVSVP